MFKIRKIYYFLLSLFFIIIPGIVFASQVLNIAWPDSPTGRPFVPEIPIPLHHIVAYFYEWGIALGGLVAFIALLMAGAKYLTSAGAPQKMKEAQDGITRALFGLGLLLSSFIILQAINPHLVTLGVDQNLIKENIEGLNVVQKGLEDKAILEITPEEGRKEEILRDAFRTIVGWTVGVIVDVVQKAGEFIADTAKGIWERIWPW